MSNKWLVFTLLLALLSPVTAGIVRADELTDLLTGKTEEPTTTDKVITTGSSTQQDRKIRQRLQEIFKELDALENVQISVNKGVITLSGEVDSSATEEKALQFARQVEGMVEVENELVVNRSLQPRLKNTWQKLVALAQQFVSGLPLLLMALLVLVLFWLAGRWLRQHQGIYRRITPNQFIANLLGQIIQLAFVVLGFILALVLLDATALIGAILGAAGIVGLAVGFAVRDTVENYIASILLSLRNPFEVNDFINIDGHEGNVLMLTSRATVLISPNGNHIRIPNAMVFKAVIVNFTRHPERRFQFDVGVDTAQNLLTAQVLALDTLKATEGVLHDPKPMVIIEQLGDSNVLLRIYAWVNQTESSFLKVRSEAIRAVKTAFDDAGIVMPEPIYNLRMMQTGGDDPPTAETPTAPSPPAHTHTHADTRDVQDVSPDLTLQKRVEEEQAKDEGQNLLNENARKEL